jgi:hypothetical protein
LRVSLETFNQLNILTTLLYCGFTPLTLALGVIGQLLRNDSKPFSRIGLALVLIPFLILLVQLGMSVRLS